MVDDRAALLFDADCGFCRWATARILRCDRERRLRPVALQSSEADELLASIPQALRLSSWHLVTGGRVRSAGKAVSPLLRMLPRGRPLAAVADTFPRTTDAAYGWIARHRGLLGRVVGAKACAVMPSGGRPEITAPTIAPDNGKGPGE